jgi:multidrug efflux pump subunit AcrA (membrane-fusion protein)
VIVGLTAAALMVSACDRDDELEIETARVVSGEVVETVAAAAELEPAARVAVTAPAGGEIVELHVDDGDEVEAGDPLLRLRSDTIELQIAQAEAALEAADAMTGLSGGGVDISPLFGAVRGQLEAVLPPLLDGLDHQAAQIEDDDVREEFEASLADARGSYAASVAELREAERVSRSEAEQATASQQRAAAAQREQARLALDAAEDRDDELTLVATADGVVELGRAGGGAGPGDLGDLGGLGGLGGGGDLEGLGDLADVRPPTGGGEDTGPLARGVEVGAGQLLATIYDLSSFSARVEVDEIDVVEVEKGQAATVLVDAYPDVELDGRVTFVALSPERGGGGGALFGVTVALPDVPDEVRLRVGLTASSEIVVREVASDTVVPTAALLRRGREDIVRVIRDGRVHDVAVDVEAIGDQQAAVSGDVEIDERVVTTGVDRLSDGDELP